MAIVPILVVRCTTEAAVPSRIVKCEWCNEDCWLSDYSGDSTIALAESMGTAAFTCSQCFEGENGG